MARHPAKLAMLAATIAYPLVLAWVGWSTYAGGLAEYQALEPVDQALRGGSPDYLYWHVFWYSLLVTGVYAVTVLWLFVIWFATRSYAREPGSRSVHPAGGRQR